MAATLDDLLNKLDELITTTEDSAKTTAAETRATYKKFFLGEEIGRALGIPNLSQPFAFIGQANQIVQERRQLMSAINKQSLGLGQSVKSLRETAEVQKGAGEFGPQIALKTAIDSLKTGTFGLSKTTFDLGMQMQAVGESSEALFRMQRESQVMGGMTVDQMDNLAKSLENARNEYGLSTEYLVDAMGKLADRLLDFNLMGITSEVNEAMVGLVSKYGAGTADLFTKAINTLTSGGNISKFARFGISEDVAGLMESGGMTPEAIESIASKAGQFFEQQVGNFRALNKAEAIAQAKAIYGEEGALFAAIAKLSPQQQKAPETREDRLSLMQQTDIQRDIAMSAGGLLDKFSIFLNAYTTATVLQGIQVIGLLLGIATTLGYMATGSLVNLTTTIMTGFGLIGGGIATMGTALVGALGPLLPIALGIAAIVAVIWGISKLMEDDKPIEIKPPKTGGQFMTNEYMAVNAELTKSILGSVFASQQMLMLSQAKQQTALMQQQLGVSNSIRKNTSVFGQPTQAPVVGLPFP